MSTLSLPPFRPPIEYPESDGLPMAENTQQFNWIVKIVGGLQYLFSSDPNVFVAGDLFWYPVEGDNRIHMAPDAMVAIGRPAGDRRSYFQWLEAGIAPQVVFEIRSPSNRAADMREKLEFYDRYGVEEYYIYDPDRLVLSGYLRQQSELVSIEKVSGHVSPRLGIQFELDDDNRLTIFRPDGKPFVTFEEHARGEEQALECAEQATTRAEQEQRLREQATARADQERRLREQAVARADQERERADRLQRELDELRRRSLPNDSGE